MRTVLDLAVSGLRHRPAPWLLLALGVAVAVVLPVFAAGLRVEAGTAAVTTAVDRLAPGSRSVLGVTSQDLRTRSWDAIDSTVRRAFADVGAADVQQTVSFRPLAVGGPVVTVGAVDRLDAAVRLTSGTLPTRCTPTACEVLEVVTAGAAVPSVPTTALRSLGLRITGVAELDDPRFVGAGLVPADLPLLLGSDPVAMARLDALTLFQRNTAWLGTLSGATVAARGGPEITRRLAGLAADVSAQSAPLIVHWPGDEVAAATDRAVTSADRFTVLGAGAACLQVGFGLVVAAGLRRRQQLVARLLVRRGAGPVVVTAVVTVQSALAIVAGAAVGVLLGAGVLLGRGTEPVAVAAAIGSALPVLVGIVVGTIGLTVLVQRFPESDSGVAGWLLTTGLVGAGIVALLLVRSATTSRSAAGAVVALLLAVGLLVARLWTPLVAIAARGRPRPGVARTGFMVARRRPLLQLAVAGVLASACATTLFAVGYRSTLQQSAADQAASQVPLDVAIGSSAQVSAPLRAVDPAAVESSVPGAEVHPVVGTQVIAFAGSPLATGLPLTGIDAATLTAMHAFSPTTGADLGAAELAERLSAVPGAAGASRVALPGGTRTVSAAISGLSDDITLDLWLSSPYGAERSVRFTRHGPGVRAAIPLGRWEVTAIEVAESDSFQMHRQHGVGEGSTDRAVAAGTLRLGPLRLDDKAASPWSWAGWASDQADVALGSGAAPSLAIEYRIEDRRVVVVPQLYDATTQDPLPVAVDPATADRAAQAGRLTLTANGRGVPARIVAVLPRFPRTSDPFVIADRAAVTALLDSSAPGTAAVRQLWISAPPASLPQLRTVLDGSSAARATLTWRADVAAAVRTDPVATRSILLLAVAGVLALLLGLAALATSIRADADETAADAYALELDGLPPPGLRALLALRAGLVIAVAVPLGLVGGWFAGLVAVRLLVVGPGGAAIVPPLVYTLTAPAVARVVGGILVAAIVVTGAVVAGAYRQRRAEPPEVDLR